MVEEIKRQMWEEYYKTHEEKDSNNKKIFVLDNKRTYDDKDYYTELQDYLIHYLHAYNIEFVINRYADTTLRYTYNGEETVDRYVVDLYRNGKKLEVDREHIYISKDYPRELFYIDDSRARLHLFRTKEPFADLEEWYVNKKVGNYFTLEGDFFGPTKRVTIADDKYGNVEIYLDEHAENLCRISERKTGKKYCIKVGKEKPTAKQCIERMVELIDWKDDIESAQMFELMIRDPRLEVWLASAIKLMPKSIDEAYNIQKKEIDEEYESVLREYREKLESLRDKILLTQKQRDLIPTNTEPVKNMKKKR